MSQICQTSDLEGSILNKCWFDDGNADGDDYVFGWHGADHCCQLPNDINSCFYKNIMTVTMIPVTNMLLK